MSEIALIGRKIGMTTLFEDRNNIPVTLVKVIPNVVIAVRDYDNKRCLVLGGNEELKDVKVNKPQVVSLARNSIKPRCSVKEFKIDSRSEFAINTTMSVRKCFVGSVVDVRSYTIGKGFQGAMKRWGFGGLPATHGVSLTHRSLGSTGNRTSPGRVFKGKKMSGHMGNKKACVQNLVIYEVHEDANVLAIKGSIPGKKGSVVYITSAVKKHTDRDGIVNGCCCEG